MLCNPRRDIGYFTCRVWRILSMTFVSMWLRQIKKFFFLLGMLALGSCTGPYKYVGLQDRLYSIDRSLPLDSSVLNFYYPYKLKIDSQMNTVIARAAAEITRGRPEGRLNNLAADGLAVIAKRHQIGFDFVHINYKALRVPLPSGPIRTYKIFELMPFENNLVTIKLKGSEVFDLFQYMARLGGDPISGASFRIEEGKAKEILIKGETLDFDKVYTVLTNDFLANGGDNASVYLKALERKDYNIKLRNAFMEYLIQLTDTGSPVNPQMDGRVISDNVIADE